MRRLFLAVLVLAVLGAALWAWRLRPDAFPTEISPEAAASAEAKLQRLREDGDTARLSGVELSSLMRFKLADQIPNLLGEPAVNMSGDTVHLRARIPTEHLPQVRELERVRAFLPDTAPVEISGRVTPLDGEHVALDIASVNFSGIPIPAHLYPTALERIGRRPVPGLAPTALPVRLPPGVGAARVENGVLILAPAR